MALTIQHLTRSVCSAAFYFFVTSGTVAAQENDPAPPKGSGGELNSAQGVFDVKHYRLELEIFPDEKRIAGTLTMKAELLESTGAIMLDLDDALTVDGVWISAPGADSLVLSKVSFRHHDGEIQIPLSRRSTGETFVVHVKYGGVPREAPRPPWDGGFTWSRTADGSHWIATTCQGEGADVWWPCKDHPSDEPDSMDIVITVPAPLIVASNGRLLEVRKAPGDKLTYHWRVSTPINNYGVALNIAPYETITTQYQGVEGEPFEFTYWVLPENRVQGEKVFEEFQRQMTFFEDVCGPYPFRADKYGVAETPHLGMEHQSIIAYGNGYRGDIVTGYDYDWLHHHELSHEWWANLVTVRDWKDFWIHEGIGTYLQAVYLERRFGPEAYAKKMAIDLKRIENKGSVAPRGARTTKDMYFASKRPDAPDIDVYMKGSWICHSLRWLVGDEVFFKILRRWAYPDPTLESSRDGSACRFASTDELLAIAEEVADMELDWFFELYLRQPELPELKVHVSGGQCTLRWKTPGDMAFPMPVEVLVGGELRRVEMAEGEGVLELPPGTTHEVDPHSRVLMKRHRW
jgi:aminopeptidase N